MRFVKGRKLPTPFSKTSSFLSVENVENVLTLADLPLGGRLLVRSRNDWRTAVVALITNEKITISISSPKGRTYRIHRLPEQLLRIEQSFFLMDRGSEEEWRPNFAVYDARW
jgi:hypothetical protein